MGPGHERSKSEYRYTIFDSLYLFSKAACISKTNPKVYKEPDFSPSTREAFCSQNPMLKKFSEMMNCQGVETYSIHTAQTVGLRVFLVGKVEYH